MNTRNEHVVSRHDDMRKQLRSQQPAGPGLAGIIQETGRYVGEFGRQMFLLAGLLLLIAIMAAATTGNQMFAEFLRWTGWF